MRQTIRVGFSRFGLGRLERLLDGVQIVAVFDPQDLPVVGAEPAGHVLGEGKLGAAVDRHPVVVVEADEPAEAEVAGQGGGLGGDPLHHVAVAAEDEGEVIDDLPAAAVEARRQVALGDGHADGVGNTLAQGAGRGLDPGGVPVFGVPGGLAAPLAEAFELVEGKIISAQAKQAVKQGGGVPAGEHEAVPVGPAGVARVVFQHPGPQHVGCGRQAHGRAGVPGLGRLDGVHRQRPNGVHAQAVQQLFGLRHSKILLSARSDLSEQT